MKVCFIDPPSAAYDENRFFDISHPQLNRDNGLLPYYQCKLDLEAAGYTVTTFDQHAKFTSSQVNNALYISFGRKRELSLLTALHLKLFAFFLLEPPLVDKKMYSSLPTLTKHFENVFIHNLTGDCYPIKNVKTEVLRKLFWPQPSSQVSLPHWNNNDRLSKVVLINAHHKPHSFKGRELYSERIKWGTKLNETIPVDLFGRGWAKKFSRSSFWSVYIKHYQMIQKIYRGPCESKLATMSQYKFALCFENLKMDGYITEKIFDCFYAGTIPIYWGGSDIEKWIPANCFIDIRKFATPTELGLYLNSLSHEDVLQFKLNAKLFLENNQHAGYFDIFSSLKLFL